jgi:hypothetical protein
LEVHSGADLVYQPRQGAQLYWSKTILVSETGICWIFFIHFNCAGSHAEHRGRCSKGPAKEVKESPLGRDTNHVHGWALLYWLHFQS